MREELHLLLQFEAQDLILSPYEYLNNSCALLFWNSECLCVRELKSVAYHHNRNAKLFLSPREDVTLFYTLPLSFFFEFPKEFCKKPGQRWPLLLCQKPCSTACSKLFQAPGMCTVRVPTVSQDRLAPRREVSWWKKETLFLSFNIFQSGFYQAVKRSRQCGKRRMAFIGVPRKKVSPNFKFLQEFLAVSLVPCAFIFYEKNLQPLFITIPPLCHVESPLSLITFNILL